MFTDIKQPVQQFPSSPIVDGSQSASTDFGMFHALQSASTKDVNNDLDGIEGDEEDDPENERVKAERVIAYNNARDAKTAAKIAAGESLNVAKSIVTLQVKPWDSDSDMGVLEKEVRSIEKDGLVWGASKLVPVGYGIMMLQINLVIEDTKISLTDLEEEISEIEEYVQSTDVIAMQKL